MKFESVTAILAGCLMLAQQAAGADTIERVGYAYEMDGDALVYTEEHRERVENGRIVEDIVTYRGADGGVIANKKLDFNGEPTSPEFRLENVVNGHVEGAKQTEDSFVVFFRKSDDHKYTEENVEVPDKAIIDGGFDRFIEINWQALMEGEVFKRPFLVPSFHKFVDFKIYLDKTTDSDAVFIMEPASFLLRIVGDEIVVTYNRQNAALKRYEGISNIRDQSGENYEVRVEFPASERRRLGDVADTSDHAE